ncbi:HAD-IIA family hydrolase [Anaerolineales bacterium HSG25]|nr:HAD-IIA family hydrolase [Anaerolineales bacterium HSG25]
MNINSIKAIVIDMDGVLWRGETLLPGFNQFFNMLYTRNIPFMLATNNARKTPAQYVARFAGFGVTVTPEQVLTSSLATATYLQNELSAGAKVYAVGEDGIRSALNEVGLTVVTDASQPVSAVVSSLDMGLTYQKLKSATILIRQGARFIATNADLTFPIEQGFAPGAGSIAAAIQAATDVEPTVVGKPGHFMFEIAVQKMGVLPHETMMIGDRLETDILGGQRAGLNTLLVTSGVDNEQSIASKGIKPDMILSGIAELVEVWG